MNRTTQKHYDLKEATKKLEHYCAYQDRCHKEVVAKLREMGMIPMAIDQIIGHLIAENFLNEERFAQSYARGKFSIKKWGRERIIRELKQRDISAYNLRAALKEIPEEDYLATLRTLAEKRWQQLAGQRPTNKKKKLIDYLRYRGWEAHLVYDMLRELAATD